MIQATYSVGESIESTDDYDLKNILVFIILRRRSVIWLQKNQQRRR
jgi:hypothetical protein